MIDAAGAVASLASEASERLLLQSAAAFRSTSCCRAADTHRASGRQPGKGSAGRRLARRRQPRSLTSRGWPDINRAAVGDRCSSQRDVGHHTAGSAITLFHPRDRFERRLCALYSQRKWNEGRNCAPSLARLDPLKDLAHHTRVDEKAVEQIGTHPSGAPPTPLKGASDGSMQCIVRLSPPEGNRWVYLFRSSLFIS